MAAQSSSPFHREGSPSLTLDLATPTIPSEELREAYERVRSDAAPDNWMTIEVKRTGMVLDAEGAGGIGELRKRFQDKTIMFGYLKYSRPGETVTFVLISFVSPRAPPIIKAKSAVASQFACSIFKHNMFMQITAAEDLTEAALEKLVKGLGHVSPSLATSPVRSVFARSLQELQKRGLVVEGGTPPAGPGPMLKSSGRAPSSASLARQGSVVGTSFSRTGSSSSLTPSLSVRVPPSRQSTSERMLAIPEQPGDAGAPAAAAAAAAGASTTEAAAKTRSPKSNGQKSPRSPKTATAKVAADKDKGKGKEAGSVAAAGVPLEASKPLSQSTSSVSSASTADSGAAAAIPVVIEPASVLPSTSENFGSLPPGAAVALKSGDLSDKDTQTYPLKKRKTAKSRAAIDKLMADSSSRTSSDSSESSSRADTSQVNSPSLADSAGATPTSPQPGKEGKAKKERKYGTMRDVHTLRVQSDTHLSAQHRDLLSNAEIVKKPKKKAAPLASPEATDLSDAGSAGPSSATTSIPTAGSAAEPGTPSDASAMTSEFGMMSLKQSAALPIPEHLLPRKSKSKRSGHAASMSRIESMTARETLRRMDSNTIPSVKHTPDAAADGSVAGAGSAGVEEGELYLAIRDHVATGDELMFLRGEQILVIQKLSEREWVGICEGIQGLLDPADVLPYSENLQATLDRKKDAAAAEPAEDDEDDGAGPKQHVQMTIEDATEFLDTLGFSRFVDQFEQGLLVDEAEVDRLTLLSDLQKTAVLKRIRFLNQLLEDEARTLQQGARALPPGAEELPEPELEASGSIRRPVADESGADIFALPAEQPEPAASLKKSSTIGGSRSGRRSKNISDLSAEELQIARKIALIQLTAMMERGRGAFAMNASRNIVKTITNAFRLRGSDRPRDDKGIFGTDLSESVEKRSVRYPGCTGFVSLFCRDVFEFLSREENLKVEGLFRIGGNQKTINELKDKVDKSGGPIDLRNNKVHDVTSLLKLYLRELPDPLFTSDYYKHFVSVGRFKEKRQQIQALQLLALFLPPANRALAEVLLNYLHMVSQHSSVNKMDTKNLAVCLAPTLFRDNFQKLPKANDKDADWQPPTVPVLQLMIECHSLLWKVPVDLQIQIDEVVARRNERQRQS